MSKHKNQDWISKKVASLREQKTRTPVQQLLVDLAHQTGTVKDEKSNAPVISEERKLAEANRRLATLLRAEAARENMEAIATKASLLVKEQKEAAKKSTRKERNGRLIRHGLLVELAGIQDRSDAELLGLLLAGKGSGPDRWASWAPAGTQRLAERDAADAAKKAEKAEKAEKAKGKTTEGETGETTAESETT